jgi:alkanesulfonate monooxygenase SsuD/methylene tetrahydromethanopterin reductase-like flavin-dependent oxidoreductase (luciferase family)
LPTGSKSDVVLGIHLHVAKDRNEAIANGALALSSQADVFLRGRLSRPVETETIKTYSTKSASREAFEKLCTPEKARQAVEAEWPNVMAVWGTPEECNEKIKFYVDTMRPEQLMFNIASGSLAQDKVLKSMRLFAEEVMQAVHKL